MKIEKFDLLKSSGISYGGHGGSKKGVIIDGDRWFLKYPKSTKGMDVDNISYSSSPLSEYLGSHIYDLIGIDVHDTKLGISDGKVVVACKDFLKSSEIILDYNTLKNYYNGEIEIKIESLSSSENVNEDIQTIMIVMDENIYFKNIPKLKDRFWDMFIIDAFIANNDRNEGNWGLIIDKTTLNLRISPVFDNGASFYNKSDDEKLKKIYEEDDRFNQSIYHSCASIFKENGKVINPLNYIQSMKNEDCNEALKRVFPKIHLNDIKKLLYDIPSKYENINIITDIQRKLYFKSMEFKYELFKDVYEKLKED